MAAPDPFRGTPEEFTKDDWLEAVGSFRPSGANFFGGEKAEAGLVGVVTAPKTRGCLRYCLGYNAVKITGAGTTDDPFVRTLQRTNPVCHPRYPNLVCTGAAEEEFSPDPQGPVRRSVKVRGEAPPNPGGNILGGGFGTYPARAAYRAARVTLRFEPLVWDLVEDGNAANESARNTFVDQEPRVELLSLSGFQMTYTEGTGLPAGYSSPQGTVYPAEVGQVLVKSDVRLTWKRVPSSWLFREGTQVPGRVLYRLGTLNDDVFLGYPAGTLMLSGARLVRTPWALQVGRKAAGDATEDRCEYTVEFLLTFFDPEKGYTGDPAVRITNNRGWNCLPYRGSLTGADGNAGRWFFATYDGAAGGRAQFWYTDFTKLFDAADNAPASEL